MRQWQPGAAESAGEQEGFKKIPEIDIFEAGPVIACKTSDIRTVKQSKVAPLQPLPENTKWENMPKGSDPEELPSLFMAANVTDIKNFRVTVTEVSEVNEGRRSVVVKPASVAGTR